MSSPPLDVDAALLSLLKQLGIQHEAIMAAAAYPAEAIREYARLTTHYYALEFYRKTGNWVPQ